jgi:glycosyltransferase involved in cell wall biosynthesis
MCQPELSQAEERGGSWENGCAQRDLKGLSSNDMLGGTIKILLVANTGWYLYNFRLPLARLLRERGVEVIMVSPHDPYVARIQAEGFRWVELKLDRRSMNPFSELVALKRFIEIYRREKPTAVHHFTIKCVLYGTIAAKLTGIRSVVNAVTGLGHLFVGSGRVVKLIRPAMRWLYRRILSARRVRVVFQNPDDLEAFTQLNLVVPDRTVLIRGSGVNLQRFSPRPGDPDAWPSPNVLFASRLLKEKGIHDYVEAARILKLRGVRATFQVAGSPDHGNPSAVSDETLDAWRREGVVDLLGHVDTVDDLISMATVVVLPSYREGTPRILLESAAMGKPIVATDVPGCREVVVHGENGYLVPARDPDALAEAIETLLNDPKLCEQMGRAGREKMLREFDDQDVAQRTVQIYETTGVLSN